MNEKPSFFAELKRRNVYKVAMAYAVVGWLLVRGPLLVVLFGRRLSRVLHPARRVALKQ